MDYSILSADLMGLSQNGLFFYLDGSNYNSVKIKAIMFLFQAESNILLAYNESFLQYNCTIAQVFSTIVKLYSKW